MKKYISIIIPLLIFALFLCSCGNNAKSSELANNNSEKSTAEGFTYRILEDGTAEITGLDVEKSFSSLTIPDYVDENVKVTSIAKDAFAGSNKLKYLTFSKYITAIGENAFKGSTICNAIMVSSRTLTEIGKGAFENCKNLTQVDLPESLKTMGDKAFADCSSLVVVTFRGNINNIDVNWFADSGNFKICTYGENKSVIDFAKNNGYDIKILEKN